MTKTELVPIARPAPRRKRKPALKLYHRPDVDPEIAKRQRPAERRCLRCHQQFPSSHAGNRLCPRCLDAAANA